MKNISNINVIMKSILESPILDLNTKSFVLIQEMKNLYDNKISNNTDIEQEELDSSVEKFMKMYKQFKDESQKFQKTMNTIQQMHFKITNLEKINQKLLNRVSVIDVEYIYKEGSDIRPKSGNIMVYNDLQKYFYIVFGSEFLDHSISKLNSLNLTVLCGWFFDKNGWKGLYVDPNDTNHCMYYDPLFVTENKNINGGSRFSMIENENRKSIILKNNTIVHIYSNYSVEKISMFQFRDINRLFVYDSMNIKSSFYLEKLLHLLNNVVLLDIDLFTLQTLFTQNYEQLYNHDLSHPLSLESLYIDNFPSDILLWEDLIQRLKENKKIDSFPFIPTDSLNKSNKEFVLNYVYNYINNDSFMKSILNDTVTEEEEYLHLCNFLILRRQKNSEEIRKILNHFPIRTNMRKMDFYVNFIKFKFFNNDSMNNICRDTTTLNIIKDCIKKINICEDIEYPVHNKVMGNQTFILWKSVVWNNTSLTNNTKLNCIMEYLIFNKDNYLDRNIKTVIDNIVLFYFSKKENHLILIEILKLVKYLGLKLDSSLMNDIISLLHDNRLDIDIVKKFLCNFIKNENVKLCIEKINLLELFSYGIHCILHKKEYLTPIQVDIQSSICTVFGVRVEYGDIISLESMLSEKCVIYDSGIVSGYFNFIFEKVSFTNNNNLFIIDKNYKNIPEHFDYLFCVTSKNIMISQNIYDKIILDENSSYDLIYNLTKFNNKYYKINVDFFKGRKEINIYGKLYTIEGNEFAYDPTTDYFRIIDLQNKYLNT